MIFLRLIKQDYHTGLSGENKERVEAGFLVVFRRRLHVSIEVGCTNNAACEDGCGHETVADVVAGLVFVPALELIQIAM